MPSKATLKRTIKLRQPNAAGQEFIKVNSKNKTSWASCNMKFQKPAFAKSLTYGQHGSTLTLTDFETSILLAGPAAIGLFITSAAVSVPVGAVYALSQFQLASSATLVSAAIPANPILAGVASFLGGTTLAAAFVSPDVKTSEQTNFNKPCDPGEGKF